MCGIVGGIAQRNVVPILLEGLKRLEYRGYDSAGLAVIEERNISRKRVLGKVKGLEDLLQSEPIAAAGSDWSTYREIQWVRLLTDAPVRLPKPVSPGRAGRFRGSGLALLQEVWERGSQFSEMPLAY